jgi:hypothetical protein
MQWVHEPVDPDFRESVISRTVLVPDESEVVLLCVPPGTMVRKGYDGGTHDSVGRLIFGKPEGFVPPAITEPVAQA